MNELILSTRTMSSREIAELTGKQHKNVLVDCDNLNASYMKMSMAEISAMEIPHPTIPDRKDRVFELTKMQTFDLMTGYSRELRIKVNRRWEELETKQKELTKLEILELALESEKKALALEVENKQLKPKAESYDRFLDVKQSMTISDVSKTLNFIDVGPLRLFKILRDKGVLSKQKGFNWNLPIQKYLEQGLFEVKKTEKVTTVDDDFPITTYYTTTYVTPKGLERIRKFLVELGYKQRELNV